MKNCRQTRLFILLATTAALAQQKAMGQQTNDEFRTKLKESLQLKPDNSKPISPNKTPLTIDRTTDEPLRVSPTTRLPTRFDRLPQPPPIDKTLLEVHVDMTVTNYNKGPFNTNIDYEKSGVVPVPDSRSITQWLFNGATTGVTPIAGKRHKVGGATVITGSGSGPGASAALEVGDFDPVRAYQRRKHAKRQKKIKQILKAYGE